MYTVFTSPTNRSPDKMANFTKLYNDLMWTHGKRPWCWERLEAKREGVAEDEMVVWHHQLRRHEFEQTLGDSEGQRSLMCYSPWGRKEVDTTWWLSNNKKAGGWGVQSPISHFSVTQTLRVSVSYLLKANKDTYLFWTDKLSSEIEVI